MMMRHRHRTLPAALAAAVALALLAVLAGCGGSSNTNTTTTPAGGGGGGTQANEGVSGSVSMMAVWTGDEQKAFKAVIDGFNAKYPNVSVNYKGAGDNLPTVLGTAVSGGSPPDVAAIAQPGLIADFAAKHALKPLTFVKPTIEASFPEDITKLGTIGGKLYSFVFKASNKSTIWYNVTAFKNAGVKPATTWEQLTKDASTIKASGVPPYSVGGADGWTLTDLFENLYLRIAGPQKYDQLTEHKIKWTDPSVKQTLKLMGESYASGNLPGGTKRALQTDFPTSVSNVFTNPPKAAMVIEADFVPGAVAETTKLKPVTGYDVSPFPTVDGKGAGSVEIAGDSVVLFNATPAAKALVTYLASPEAAEIWAKQGGFSSANTKVPASAYSDALTRRTAGAIAKAQVLRFDLSDLAPPAFGGTPAQGMWKALQDFLANPTDVDGTAAKLESLASKAYKKS